MTKKEREILKKITKSLTFGRVKDILEQVRKPMICSNITAIEALKQCANKGIISKQDEEYPLFEKLAELLDSKKTRNIEISDLSRIICYLEVEWRGEYTLPFNLHKLLKKLI